MLKCRSPFALFTVLALVFVTFRQLNASQFTGTCAAFSKDGVLATGALRSSGDVEIKIHKPGLPLVNVRIQQQKSSRCQQKFSGDGHWLVTSVAGNPFKILVMDAHSGRLVREFEISQLEGARDNQHPSQSPLSLVGFFPDNSIGVWAYDPDPKYKRVYPTLEDRHLQRWSREGVLLSDLHFGVAPSGYGAFTTDDLTQIWVPTTSDRDYINYSLNGTRFQPGLSLTLPKSLSSAPSPIKSGNELLAVVGDEREAQHVVELDPRGKEVSKTMLPFFPNLLFPFAVDWFDSRMPEISADGEIAAIVRQRVAWVFIDTDRDWGSEIDVLQTNPLQVITIHRVSRGRIGAVAIDHRGSTIRVVGFWKGRWHDLRNEISHPDSLKEAKE